MRKALITIAAALLLAGCTGPNKERVRFFYVEYQGHTYIAWERYGGAHSSSHIVNITHDPDCLCHHKENE